MDLNEIFQEKQKLIDETNPNGLFQLGKDRAFKYCQSYELDLMRKSILATIQKEFNDLSAAKSEIEARSHEKYIKHLNKMIEAKLAEELSRNKHEQAKLKYEFLDRQLSILQSQMKQR
jgi:hypothetical protein